jgi:hypothetical protein
MASKEDLIEFELINQIRIKSKEATQYDKDLINLARETHDLFAKREKRLKYVTVLRRKLSQLKTEQDHARNAR